MENYENENKVLIVDDQVDDIEWLIDLLTGRGYSVDLESNEFAARKRLESIADSMKKTGGLSPYKLLIFDIMVAVKDLMEIESIDEDFYLDSRRSGIRLCDHARRVGISEDRLPIVCISNRDDAELKQELRDRSIPLFDRNIVQAGPSIQSYIEEKLPRVALG